MSRDRTLRAMAGAFLVAAVWVARPALASHSHQEFGDIGPLGNESTYILVMDALPAGEDWIFSTQSRTVVLEFDLELFGLWTGSQFEVEVGSTLLLQRTFGAGTGIRTFPFTLTFPLHYNWNGSTDMAVFFEKTGALSAGTWTLRNVSLDWSQPIPEPATAASLALGLIALGLRRRPR